jgi:hypothetical protein
MRSPDPVTSAIVASAPRYSTTAATASPTPSSSSDTGQPPGDPAGQARVVGVGGASQGVMPRFAVRPDLDPDPAVAGRARRRRGSPTSTSSPSFSRESDRWASPVRTGVNSLATSTASSTVSGVAAFDAVTISS